MGNDFQTPGPINILRGIVPVASDWGTDPTNLERCTDGNTNTVTGTGEKVMAASGTFGYLIFDLGSIKTVLIGGRFGTWSTAGTINIWGAESDDNITYRSNNIAIINNASVAETVRPTPTIVLHGRYIRLQFFVSAASTARTKIYEVMGWELQL